jgi:hypothetical protein
MADLADVELGLVSMLEAAIFPGGVPSGDPAFSSPIGAPCRILRGWPDADPLNADLAAGTANVSVYSMPGHSRPVVRYFDNKWRVLSRTTPTITAARSGSTVTFGGVGGPGQIAGAVVGRKCAYAVAATGTPEAVASGLAALVPGASASGAVLTLPTTDFEIRIGAPITEQRETRRQVQGLQIILWCASPAQRDTVARVVDGALAVSDQDFIPLQDGSGGLLRYTGTTADDVPSKADLWKRALHYTVEYPTTTSRQSPPALFPGVTATVTAMGVAHPDAIETVS